MRATGGGATHVDCVRLNGATIEPTQTFTVTLANPAGATLGVATAAGTIEEDDVAAPADDDGADDCGTSEGAPLALSLCILVAAAIWMRRAELPRDGDVALP